MTAHTTRLTTTTAVPVRRAMRLHVEVAGSLRQVTVEPIGTDSAQVLVSWDDVSYVVDAVRRAGGLSLLLSGASHASHDLICHQSAPGELRLGLDGRQVTARVSDGRRRATSAVGNAEGDHAVVSPMPGRVVRVSVAPGDVVTGGQRVVAVEAMKMENELVSPVDGVVSEVRVAVDDSVEAGALLVVVRAEAVDHGEQA